MPGINSIFYLEAGKVQHVALKDCCLTVERGSRRSERIQLRVNLAERACEMCIESKRAT
jgi:hypothetical protein